MTEGGKSFICAICDRQYEIAVKPFKNCPICEDERHFVNWS
jgi:rubrerythrin